MATFYFNGAVNNEWTNLGNWWTDDQFTVPATNLPTSLDDVIASASIATNSGIQPTVANFTLNDPNQNYHYISIAITVNGNATFNDSSLNYGTVTGDAVFNDYSSSNGTVSGDATFNDSSSNPYSIVNGNATFNDNSFNYYGTVTGNAVFNDSSTNNGTVTGDATFNGSSFAYPTATYGGTVTFQNRTPYPLKRGVNSSSLLAVV